MREKSTIRIRRGVNGAKYCACDESGNPLRGFDRLSDIRKRWEKEIRRGQVELVRELNKTPDMETTNATIECIHEILMSSARNG